MNSSMGRFLDGDCSFELVGDSTVYHNMTKDKEVQLVNLESLVQDWVNDFPLDKSVRKEADDLISSDYNWQHVRFYHGTTEYHSQRHETVPTQHVLFSVQYSNDTDREQVYPIKTDRRTTSTCNIIMDRAFMIGHEMALPVASPTPAVQANAGFKGEIIVQRADNQKFTEELIWTLDTQIPVPARHVTRAELILREHEYSGEFKVETKMEGKVHVTIRSKKDGSVLMPITADVRNIFRANKLFDVKTDGVYFESRGQCTCRFGIEQHVRLSQMSLVDVVD